MELEGWIDFFDKEVHHVLWLWGSESLHGSRSKRMDSINLMDKRERDGPDRHARPVKVVEVWYPPRETHKHGGTAVQEVEGLGGGCRASGD